MSARKRRRRTNRAWYAGILVALALLLPLGAPWLMENAGYITIGLAVGIAVLIFAKRPRRTTWSTNTTLASILMLSTFEFEVFCAQLLERSGFRAGVTPQTGDRGVDVNLRTRSGEIGIAQCKLINPHRKVGRPVLQALAGEMGNCRATFGYVITTGGFTDEARSWAENNRLRLIDGRDLTQWAAAGGVGE